jgi:hypothetical protein
MYFNHCPRDMLLSTQAHEMHSFLGFNGYFHIVLGLYNQVFCWDLSLHILFSLLHQVLARLQSNDSHWPSIFFLDSFTI